MANIWGSRIGETPLSLPKYDITKLQLMPPLEQQFRVNNPKTVVEAVFTDKLTGKIDPKIVKNGGLDTPLYTPGNPPAWMDATQWKFDSGGFGVGWIVAGVLVVILLITKVFD